ncbi:hypothetical protein PT7_2300 [Pusillimonas sp. T7-7]|uniref:VOC family protein n=1 Tax=Pusillimonas sp. (strain T7-7) TaxID=1007105 RepID=UPI00020856D3|nr:VOC family protein [Pusillimonas sp. T7-7]AEC20840.1 hypothetical protein PT7_2300 [Pusillimonas sp. T7-7]
MPSPSSSSKSAIIPCLRYRNAAAAIEWLCTAFGFKKQAVYSNADGTIAHAQLVFGNGMIMLGSVAPTEWGKLMKQPDEIEGAETQSAYVVVSDADAVYNKAKEAGAEVILDIKDEDYGGRGFTCRDLEGHLWNFGTYDPWQGDG